jgi:hypothetical protein
MDSKVLAIEICSKYVSLVDRKVCHPTNIETHLKPLVEELTHDIVREYTVYEHELLSSQKQMQNRGCGAGAVGLGLEPLTGGDGGNVTTSTGTSSGSDDWRHHLQRTYSTGGTGTTDKNAGFVSPSPDNENETRSHSQLSSRSWARLGAFVDGIQLAVPSQAMAVSRSSSLSISVSVSSSSASSHSPAGKPPDDKTPQPQQQSTTRTTTNTTNTSRGKKIRSMGMRRIYLYPQIDEDDLLARVQLYIKSLHRVFHISSVVEKHTSQPEECVVHREPHRISEARMDCVLRAFVANVSCVTAIQPALTALLDCTTREVLGVGVLGPRIMAVIHRKLQA